MRKWQLAVSSAISVLLLGVNEDEIEVVKPTSRIFGGRHG